MTIDGRSLLAVAAALCLVFGLILLALGRRLGQPIAGLRLWAAANFMLGSAAALHALQGLAPLWLPALVGNALILAGRASSVAALHQIDGRRVPTRWLAGTVVALTLAVAAALLAWPGYHLRGLLMVAGMALFAGWGVQTLLVGAPPSISRALTMIGLAGLVLSNLSRLWVHASGVDTTTTIDFDQPAIALYIGVLVILDVLCNVGFVLLITDRMHEWVLRLARTDHLTGALSRGALCTQAQRDLHRARRQRTPTAAFIVDVDRFKSINDQCGHAAGDAVLRHVALHGRTVLRCTDLFGRWGGDEFVAILPETDVATATAIAERLRMAVGEADGRVTQALPPISVSIGIAVAAHGADSENGIEALIARADGALYEAKHAGRNRTRVADEPAAASAAALEQAGGSP